MTSPARQLVEDVVDMVFGAADMLAERDGDERDRALTVCLEAISVGLQQTTRLTSAESWLLAIDLLLGAVTIG